MPALFFDTVTLHRDKLSLPGAERTFAELGVSDGATLRLYARELTVVSVPDRSLNIAADRLTVASPNAFQLPASGARQVRVAAQRLEGAPLRIVCQGRAGAAGAPGRAG